MYTALITVEGKICKSGYDRPAIKAGTFDGRDGKQTTYCSFRVSAYNGKDSEGNSNHKFFDCTLYGQLAENAAGILKVGDLVTVSGRLFFEDYERPDGSSRETKKIKVNFIGKTISRFDPKQDKNDNYDPETGTVGRVQYSEKAGKSRAAQNGVVHADNAPVSLRKEAIPDEEFPLDFSEIENPSNDGKENDIPF